MESRCRQSAERVEELRRGLGELEAESSRVAREVEVLAEERAVRDAAASRAEEARREAQDAFVAADAALRNGDLAEYQRQVRQAEQSMKEALEKLGR